jgi:hypothetical protein
MSLSRNDKTQNSTTNFACLSAPYWHYALIFWSEKFWTLEQQTRKVERVEVAIALQVILAMPIDEKPPV